MHNEGGRPFAFPGKVPGFEHVFPDVDRLNPEYFQYMDRKIDYLNAQGFVPFIEVARSDVSQAWRKYYDWPESYARFIQYVFSRYQANNVHPEPDPLRLGPGLDPVAGLQRARQPRRREVRATALWHARLVQRPLLQLPQLRRTRRGAVADPATRSATGASTCTPGTSRRSSASRRPMPALNGEPYYDSDPNGWPYRKRPSDRVEEALYCRSGMYSSVLSGGLAGHIYGAMGLWQGSIEEAASPKMWETLTWKSGDQMRHLRTFVMAQGARYRDLVPDAELVTPCRTGDPNGYKGWAYCAGTEERDFFLLYFEKEYPDGAIFRGGRPGASYRARWFDPRLGEWHPIDGPLVTDPATGRIPLPATPTNDDWGLALELA